MEEFYLQIRNVHIGSVLASGGLFLLRGLGVNLFNASWPMWAPVRYLSYTIDTVLLTAALMLMTIVHQYPFVHHWLTVKVLLLVVYIVLGSFALKRGKTRNARLGFFLSALAVFAFIFSVARAHNPLGVFSFL
ncbi:MAG TPA: SirB2 family protein [Vitreimonas sp.]|uniref:SirB2 family protein n=1 Tax=Vitreimonas sp. TaxID=3069702 RepID=UPI002D53D8A0|nr:SirB2 family protein [Vitreimonas sp.]HYD89290.1 SirB2 family protein [Vitreimonas sp.]